MPELNSSHGRLNRLLQILKDFPHKRVLIAGDLIADQFLYGEIARVSREAPVLVLNYCDLVTVPGGAANAANNLLDLGCKVELVGRVGKDAPGRELLRLLKRKGAQVRRVSVEPSYVTPVKTRILAGAHHSTSQQVVRLDRIPPPCSVPPVPAGGWGGQAMAGWDAIILSDYGYGTVTDAVIERARRQASMRRIPLLVDSRFGMARFTGVTSITPNITELEAAEGKAIGDDADRLKRLGMRVLRRQRLDSLLVTQGRFGMTLFERNKRPVRIPVFGTDEVADVTGAGDTVIAVFTLALACGGTHEEAARLANYAGGIVVMKRGTATATRQELCDAVTSDLSG